MKSVNVALLKLGSKSWKGLMLSNGDFAGSIVVQTDIN